MSSKDWDESFIQRFRESHKAEKVVAVYLLLQGNSVKINQKVLRPDWSQRYQYSDSGDLIVNNKRVEVKGLSVDFEIRAYPYKDILICSKFGFDKAEPRPDYYFLLNKAMTVAAIVDVEKTMKHWFVTSVTDRKRNEHYDCYCMPLSFVQWRELK